MQQLQYKAVEVVVSHLTEITTIKSADLVSQLEKCELLTTAASVSPENV